MKLKTDFIESLVKEDNPLPLVWEFVRENIWDTQADVNIEDYYWEGEKRINEFEKTLNAIFGEFYTEHLPSQCLHANKKIVEEDFATIIMDGLSLREAALLIPVLKDKGYVVEEQFGTSAIPSETLPFREKINYRQLKKDLKNKDIATMDESISGDEEFIWCRFPDAIYESIQAGKTKIANIKEMYEKTSSVLLKLVDGLDSNLVVTSDHGYIRTESGCTFQVEDSSQQKLRTNLGGARYKDMDDKDLDHLVSEGWLVSYDGKYLARARTTWPVQGKYSVFNHGGISIMECITPRIIIKKD